MKILTSRQYLEDARPLAQAVPERIHDDVRRILDRVRRRGDAAVAEYAKRFDGQDAKSWWVPRDRWQRAWDGLAAPLRRSLRLAARNIATFQRALKPASPVRVETSPGIRLRCDWVPLGRVACYAPGGRAAYPSTVLMTVIPARVAGVDEVIVVSPPQAGSTPSPLVLAAAHLAKADKVLALGGAHAMAAMAYGTQSLPRADKIVGPGNAWVAEAKRQLEGTVGTDGVAGPSELGIYATSDTDAETIAWDLAAQAEHDPDARAVVVLETKAHAQAVVAAARRVADQSPRAKILKKSLTEQGTVVVARSANTALRVLEAAAPEHIQLMGSRAQRLKGRLRQAGTVFDGAWTPAPLGDYVTGANHVLPTAGTARWRGALGVHDFLKPVVRQNATRRGMAEVGPAAVAIAEAEGLDAHAESVRRRLGA